MQFKFLITVLIGISACMPVSSQVSLTIEINNLRNSKGQVLLQLLDENQKELKGYKVDIKENKSLLVIDNLKPGKYGFRYFHDENKNSKMDKSFMGIPEEGFGFSKNAKGTFGPPSFEKWVFDLRTSAKMTCDVSYF